MVKDEIMIKILDKASDIVLTEQIKKLQLILEEELYNYEIIPLSTELALTNNINDKIFIFIASKKLEGKSPKTLESYQRELLRFSQCMKKDIKDINTMDIRMYLAQYSKNNSKNTTINTKIYIFKSFFGWLHREEYIGKNPMTKINVAKVEKRIRNALTLEELEMLRIACKSERDRAIVEFFYSTGCRLDEVCKLNKQDINWNNDSVKVIGKGNKERVTYLNAKSKVYLWQYLNQRKDNNEALFVSSKFPYKRMGQRGIEKVFNKLGCEAGITKSVFPHIIRHTTATNMLRSGASLIEVQRLLGHENPSTTEVYADLDDSAVQYSHRKHLI